MVVLKNNKFSAIKQDKRRKVKIVPGCVPVVAMAPGIPYDRGVSKKDTGANCPNA
jgi:hypothetical protein